MATTYKLAQVQGSASTGTYSTLYDTSASVTAIISNLLIANQASAAVTVRVGIDTTAGTPGAAEWLLYDVVVGANDTLSFGPLSLGNTQFLRVSSSANTCTFSAAVAEIS
jgi:hypothetical protein